MKSEATKRKREDENVEGARFQSVLVPIDLTATSDRVLGRLSRLPLAEDARVTLVHVVPSTLPPEEQRKAERDADKALVAEARHLRTSLGKGVRVEAVVTIGSAAREIGAAARRARAELVVMGRGGGRALRDAFIGSTAERVIRQAQLPVLVVRLAPRSDYERPLLALDLEHPAGEVVRLAMAVLSPPRPRLAVFHALDIPYGAAVYPSLSESAANDARDDAELSAKQKLTKLVRTAFAEANVQTEDAPPWTAHVRLGSPRYVVERAARTIEADLLVVGTCGHTGAAYVFLGTVAGELLREVKCDVLVVPPKSNRKKRAARGRG